MKRLIIAGLITLLPATTLAQLPEAKLLSLVAAVEAVEGKVAGHVIEAEMDREKGRFVFEMDVVEKGTLSKVRLDARTGEIISTKKSWLKNTWRDIWDSDRYDLPDTIAPLSKTLKDIEQHSTGSVQKVEFDVEDGVSLYEIKISSGAGKAEIYVDVKTGERLPAGYKD